VRKNSLDWGLILHYNVGAGPTTVKIDLISHWRCGAQAVIQSFGGVWVIYLPQKALKDLVGLLTGTDQEENTLDNHRNTTGAGPS
jgi:hypothetical protein